MVGGGFYSHRNGAITAVTTVIISGMDLLLLLCLGKDLWKCISSWWSTFVCFIVWMRWFNMCGSSLSTMLGWVRLVTICFSAFYSWAITCCPFSTFQDVTYSNNNDTKSDKAYSDSPISGWIRAEILVVFEWTLCCFVVDEFLEPDPLFKYKWSPQMLV